MSPGHAVKEIFIFIDDNRPPLRPAAGPRSRLASSLPLSLKIAARIILDPEG
jgi:hypothetical protein